MGGIFHYPGFDSLEDLNHINYIAQWNDSTWDSVGNSFPMAFHQVFSLAIYNKTLIAGGTSDSGNIARWNSNNWSTMDSGMNAWLNASAVFNGNLYAGGGRSGGFNMAGGRKVDGIAVWGNDTFTGEQELKSNTLQTDVYPNPSNGIFTIALQNANTTYNVEVYNVFGEKVYAEATEQSQVKSNINLTGQPNGVYLYRVISQNGNLLGEGKLVIQK